MKTHTLHRFNNFLSEDQYWEDESERKVTANAVWEYIDKDGDFAVFPLFNTNTGIAFSEDRIDALGIFLSNVRLTFTLFEMEKATGNFPDAITEKRSYLFIEEMVEGQAKHIAERFKLDMIIVGNKSGAFSIDLIGDKEKIFMSKGDMMMGWVAGLLT
jgi:hypothetical protein